MLNPGDSAPSFRLSDQNQQTHSLADYQGKWLVVYFYPADDTPGCTKEACSFRDEKGRLEDMGAVVLGVSADGVESHGKFASKFGLNFPLLADTQKTMIHAYGSWGSKNIYGKEVVGILRKTFIIDPQGRIAKIWDKVNAEGHALEVAEALTELQG
jgi:peroxiredoxin Q/BCP